MQRVLDHETTTLVENKRYVMQMQPPAPAKQLLTPLRRPPSTPRAVACAVHDDIMRSVHLAEASMPEGVKHSRLLCQEAKEVSHALNFASYNISLVPLVEAPACNNYFQQ